MNKKLALFETAIERYWESGGSEDAALQWVEENSKIYDLNIKDKYDVADSVTRMIDCIKKLSEV